MFMEMEKFIVFYSFHPNTIIFFTKFLQKTITVKIHKIKLNLWQHFEVVIA